MSNLIFWRDKLWREVERIYRPEKPIYLSFDAAFLRKSLTETSRKVSSQDEAVKLFNDDCADMFHIGKSDVIVKPESFDVSGIQGRSHCIVIAAQQILAAEMMVGDDAYSADSYYARYRGCLGVRTDIGKLPFEYQTHRRVWDTLKCELLRLPQANEGIITFAEGIGSKNKYRNFPVSQALLDEESLRRIAASKKDLSSLSKDRLIFWLRTENLDLPLRAKKKLRIDSLHEGICRQVKSFVDSEDYASKAQKKRTKDQEEVRLVPADILLEETFIGFSSVLRLGFREALTKRLRSSEVQRLVTRLRALSLVPGQFSGWVGAESFGSRTIHPDADYVLLKDNHELGGSFRNTVCEGLPVGIKLFATSSVTSPPVSERLEAYSRSLRFEGGICLDELRTKYLCGHPPTKFVLGDSQIHAAELVLLDGTALKLKDAMARMADAKNQTIFNLEVRKKNRELQFWSTKDLPKVRHGYKILASVLNIKPTVVDEAFSYFEYLGFDELEQAPIKSLSVTEAELISYTLLPAAYWIRVGRSGIKHSLDLIGDSTGGRKRLGDRIRRTQSLPAPLLKRLSPRFH